MNDDDVSRSRRRFLAGTGALGLITATGWPASVFASDSDGSPRKGGTLRIARSEAIDGFKLDGQTANASYQISQALMEPLLRYKPNGKGVQPGLAESVSQAPDGKSLTLHLTPNAKFSNGQPVTPADVAFSVAQWKAGPNYGSLYAIIDSVSVVDDHTVRLELTRPDTSLSAFLTWSIAGIIPKDFAGQSEQEFWQQPIGAGPFKVERWEAAGDIVLSRNPHYFRPGRPYADRLVCSLTSDPNQRRLQFKSKQIDAVNEITPLQASQYAADQRVESALHFTDTLLFNTKQAPFNNLKVRKAIALAIDYSGIMNGLYKGFAELPTGWLPPNIGLWAPPSGPYFRQDLAAARKLIDAAGLGNQPLELIYPTDSGYELLSQVVQGNLQTLGLNVNLVGSETGTFLDKAYNGRFDLAVWSYNAISPDIADPVAFILSTNMFFTGYSPDRLQKLLNKYYAASGQTDKKAVVTEIQNLGAQDIPFVALDHYRVTTAVQANVHGIQPTPWGAYYYDGVWKGR